MLLAGEAGSGKSSLICAMLARLPETVPRAVGICDCLHHPRPHGPLHDIAGALGEAFRKALDPGDSDADRFAALPQAIATLGHGAVLVIEDVQCADPASLDTLIYLCRRADRLGALIVLSWRDDEVGPDHPLVRLLDACQPQFTRRIALPCLSREATAELARSSRTALPDLFERSGGNPALIHHLITAAAQSESIPRGVANSVERRVLTLSEANRHWLRLAALCPGALAAGAIAALAEAFDLSPDDIPMWCGLLVETRRNCLDFRHPLLRDATITMIPLAERLRLHQRVKSVISAFHADLRDKVAPAAPEPIPAPRPCPPSPHRQTKRGPYTDARAHPFGLTRREVDILRMIVDGASNREIAEKLGRSLRTVEHHVSAILGKMGMESRVQAALFAVNTPDILDPRRS